MSPPSPKCPRSANRKKEHTHTHTHKSEGVIESRNAKRKQRKGGNKGIKQTERDGELHVINLAGKEREVFFQSLPPPLPSLLSSSSVAHNGEIGAGEGWRGGRGSDNPPSCTS